MATDWDLESFHRDGYVQIKNVLTQEELAELREAIEVVFRRVNDNPLPYKARYTSREEDGWDTWGVADILSPQLRHPAFDSLFSNEKIVDAIRRIIPGELRFWTMHSFWAPREVDYELVWHRDQQDPYDYDQPGQTTFLLANLSLYADDAFRAVPGTHVRALNEEELASVTERTTITLPNEVIIHCEPGDLVLFNALILHRGSSRAGSARRTIHFSVQERNEAKGGYTSRPWMKDEQYMSQLDPFVQALIRALLDWERANPARKSLVGMKRAYRDHNHITG